MSRLGPWTPSPPAPSRVEMDSRLDTQHHDAATSGPFPPLGNSIADSSTREQSPKSDQSMAPTEPLPSSTIVVAPVDRDSSDLLLKQCAGRNKKTKLPCSAIIGKNAHHIPHPTFLPTCRAHRHQRIFAGRCRFRQPHGQPCGQLFRWTPPNLELCTMHSAHPNTPCYLLRLPLELRREIVSYLLPNQPIGSSTTMRQAHGVNSTIGGRNTRTCYNSNIHRQPETSDPSPCASVFPTPFMNLILVNRQISEEVRDLFFRTAVFNVDVRRDGTFVCGRRLLEPKRADGSSHNFDQEATNAMRKFLVHFNWAAVRNYRVDILVENWSAEEQLNAFPLDRSRDGWDEEVELYDMRDYISVVVSGILAKSHVLCKLSVRICLASFHWSSPQMLAHVKLIVGPFERLRNVRLPRLIGVYLGLSRHNGALYSGGPSYLLTRIPFSPLKVCSVPTLPTHTPIMTQDNLPFATYAVTWTRWISSSSTGPIIEKAPIQAMFTSFKDVFVRLAKILPHIAQPSGRSSFLHRARVAREQEDVESFRGLQNELLSHWHAHLLRTEQTKRDLNDRVGQMLRSDIYPQHEWYTEEESAAAPTESSGAQAGTWRISDHQPLPSFIFSSSSSSSSSSSPTITTTTASSTTIHNSPNDTHTIPYPPPYQHPDTTRFPLFSFPPAPSPNSTHLPPTPSLKRRRIDSSSAKTSPTPPRVEPATMEETLPPAYVGKGKGRML